MATVYKAAGSRRYMVEYRDSEGRRRRKAAFTDKSESQRLANELEDRARKVRNGLVDIKAESFRDHDRRLLADHINDWRENMIASGSSEKHVSLFSSRAARVVAIVKGAKLSDIEPARNATREQVAAAAATLSASIAPARLSDLTTESVQKALGSLKAAGRSLATCNHHRAAIKALSAWLCESGRTKRDALKGVKGFNAREDRRHDRRTVSLDELRRLVEVAEHGPKVLGVTGRVRSLVYRVAASTGFRYSEISAIRPESFNWDAPSVTVPACYTKNGKTATQNLPADLANDLAAYVAALPEGKPLFNLPRDKGAKLLRPDLKAAGIEYRDAAGLVFDFHGLRCEAATLADAAGVSRGVIQKFMRHSNSALTDHYVRPRAVQVEAVASMLPTLKPTEDDSERVIMTGTDSRPVSVSNTPSDTPEETVDESNVLSLEDLRNPSGGLIIRRSGVRVASPVIRTRAESDRLRPRIGLLSRVETIMHDALFESAITS
jgi:integrase